MMKEGINTVVGTSPTLAGRCMLATLTSSARSFSRVWEIMKPRMGTSALSGLRLVDLLGDKRLKRILIDLLPHRGHHKKS
jgi:hypothetical protein